MTAHPIRPLRAFPLDDSPIAAYGANMSQPEPEPLSVRCGRVSAVFWFCVQTHPQAERWARDNLVRSGYPVFLPMCAVLKPDRVLRTLTRRVEVPLFAGYLFVQLGAGEPATPVRYSPGVARLLGREGMRPDPVPDATVEALQATEASRHCLTPADAQNRPRWPPGAAVRLSGGAFAGHDAVVLRLEAELAVVALPIFGHVREALVGVSLLVARV